MKFHDLTLVNIGPYRGENAIRLECTGDDGRSVVLFGGNNGAGKTNILESVKWCFLGKRAFGARITDAQYQSEILNRVHRNEGVKEAAVILTFSEFATWKGKEASFKVKRSWSRESNGEWKEELAIFEGSEWLSSVPLESWQDFLYELVPPSLASLFFFDAEKIEELASEDSIESTEALREAVESLFGISTVKKLLADLSILERKMVSQEDGAAAKEIQELHSKKDTLESELAEVSDKLTLIQDTIERERTKQLRTEDEFRAKGGQLAAKREQWIAARDVEIAKTATLNDTLKTECDLFFPFLLCKDLVSDLRKEVEENLEVQRKAFAADYLKRKAAELEKAFSDAALKKTGLGLDKEQREKIKLYADGLFQGLVSNDNEKSKNRSIDLSQKDFAKLLGWMDEIEGRKSKQARKLADDIETSISALSKAESKVNQLPDDASMQPLLAEIQLLAQKIGSYQQEEKTWQEKQGGLELQVGEVQRQLEKLAKKYVDASDQGLRLERALGARAVAKEFAQRLARAKLEKLAGEVKKTYNDLARKGDVIDHVHIHPETYKMEVYVKGVGQMPKDRLSAGERQILAISILWSLSRLAGRSLPVVIDTPLGRLDSEHRKALLTKYFPKASHQVLILSTDEEVDAEYLKLIKPHVAKVYELQYDKRKGATKVTEGYFGGLNV